MSKFTAKVAGTKYVVVLFDRNSQWYISLLLDENVDLARIKSIPTTLSLTSLTLNGIPLEKLGNDFFNNTQHIISLELQNCELFSIADFCFTSLTDLKYLDLSNNDIASLNFEEHLPKTVEFLSLVDNNKLDKSLQKTFKGQEEISQISELLKM